MYLKVISIPQICVTVIDEVCDGGTYEKRCRDGEVILVQSAKYGRMALGNCITKDYGQLGCYKDVTDIFKSKCAGKKSCSMFITKNDEELIEGYPACGAELFPYLEIDSSCQAGKPQYFVFLAYPYLGLHVRKIIVLITKLLN